MASGNSIGAIIGNLAPDERKIWEDGYRAGQKRDERQSNPFDPNTREWELWDDGWYNGYE